MKTEKPTPQLAHTTGCAARAYADNDRCDCEPLSLNDVEARDAWVSDRYHAALCARPLQDAGIVLRDLQALWVHQRLNGVA